MREQKPTILIVENTMSEGKGQNGGLSENLRRLRRELVILDPRTGEKSHVLRDPKTGEALTHASTVSKEIVDAMLKNGRLEYVDAKGDRRVVLFDAMPEEGRKQVLQARLEEKFASLGYRLDKDGRSVNLPRIDYTEVTRLELLMYPVGLFSTETLSPEQVQARHEKHQAKDKARRRRQRESRREAEGLIS